MTKARPVPITVPELGSDRITFSLWHVAVGEHVTDGDRLAELLIPGATFDVPAPVTGVVAERLAQPGDSIRTGQTLGTIQEE